MNGTKMRFDECDFLWNGFTMLALVKRLVKAKYIKRKIATKEKFLLQKLRNLRCDLPVDGAM